MELDALSGASLRRRKSDVSFTSESQQRQAFVVAPGTPMGVPDIASRPTSAHSATGDRDGKPARAWDSESVSSSGSSNFFSFQHKGQAVIPLSMLPERTASRLRFLDRSDTGLITTKKLEHAMIALANERKHTRRAFQGFLTVMFFALILLLSACGVTYVVLQLSKEITLSRDNVLVSTSGETIGVASADFELRNNSLIERGCAGGACPTLSATLDKVDAVLSSELSDEALASLASISIAGPTGSLHLRVDAFARFEEKASTHGSVVVLYTQVGDISLDGSSVTFEPGATTAFERAGFLSKASSRWGG